MDYKDLLAISSKRSKDSDMSFVSEGEEHESANLDHITSQS